MIERPHRRRLEARSPRSFGARHDPPVSINDIDGAEIVAQGLIEKDGVGNWIFSEGLHKGWPIELARQSADLRFGEVFLLIDQGATKKRPALHCGLHTAREPIVHAARHQKAKK